MAGGGRCAGAAPAWPDPVPAEPQNRLLGRGGGSVRGPVRPSDRPCFQRGRAEGGCTLGRHRDGAGWLRLSRTRGCAPRLSARGGPPLLRELRDGLGFPGASFPPGPAEAKAPSAGIRVPGL